MGTKMIGKQTVKFTSSPGILGYGSVVGKKEGEGPISDSFDEICTDSFFGENSWEKAESKILGKAVNIACEKAEILRSQLSFIFAGDLLNQCISSVFAMRDSKVPFFGLYGACSTMGEGIALAAMAVDGGYADYALAATSSHFCSAERQFRMPLEYGGQRTPTAQWTVTGAGACVIGNGAGQQIKYVTQGKIVDRGVKDANNMGAAMAPAAYETIKQHLEDLSVSPDYYDMILTGDLGYVGSQILCRLFSDDGIDISHVHNDCGMIIFDREIQDVHSGGSGCGCCASVFNGYVLNGMKNGLWNRILFCPTGALMSPTSAMQGESIPSICTALCIENGGGV